MTIEVPRKTVVMFADIACPWAHAAVHRFHVTRDRLELHDAIRLDVRAFPLELINDQSTPKRILEAEIPVVGTMEPDAGWQIWQARPDEWPVTILPALEAVYAAKRQGLEASEELDRALRRALFGHSINISMQHEIIEVAESCPLVDTSVLEKVLIDGEARSAIFGDLEIAQTDQVQGSPHFFLSDGTNVHNPGVTVRWEGEHGAGFPVVEKDEPSIYEDLLERASGR